MSEQVRDGGAAPEVPLPPGIALAWGRAERPRRGPKPGLSLERIVAAGIHLAVTDGLGSVSMGRVAAELGASTMALYRYVPAKDDLLTLMVDTALGAPSWGDQPGRRMAGRDGPVGGGHPGGLPAASVGAAGADQRLAAAVPEQRGLAE